MVVDLQDFNSQPHKEADVDCTVRIREHRISTHSLTRRLTSTRSCQCYFVIDFNSQPHKEADGEKLETDGEYGTFQLTASQGG